MIVFKTKEDLESQLLADLVLGIKTAIQTYGDARILLSGGSSPKTLYQTLAKTNLTWSKVHIGLVDDRNVPVTNDFSNEKMIRSIFVKENNQAVKIYSLLNIDNNLKEVEKIYKPFFERIDFTILGMGNDSHTASLFPGDKKSEELLRSEESSINYTTAPSYPTERITCSKGLLKTSKEIVLMIFGETKKEIFSESAHQSKPISYFIKEISRMKTYYSPIK